MINMHRLSLTSIAHPYIRMMLEHVSPCLQDYLRVGHLGLPPTHFIIFCLVTLAVVCFILLRHLLHMRSETARKRTTGRLSRLDNDLFIARVERDELRRTLAEEIDRESLAQRKIRHAQDEKRGVEDNIAQILADNEHIAESIENLKIKVAALCVKTDEIKTRLMTS